MNCCSFKLIYARSGLEEGWVHVMEVKGVMGEAKDMDKFGTEGG